MSVEQLIERLEKARNEFFHWRVVRRQAKPHGKRRAKALKLQDFWEARKHRLAQRLKKARAAERRPCGTPGDPCWGGCRALTDWIDQNIPGVTTSRKRNYVPAGGSTNSEHLESNVNSDAIDKGLVNDYAQARRIYAHFTGLDTSGWQGDYSYFYFTYEGMRFRCQLIAGTHGTGPHLHSGFTRIA